MKRSGSIWIPLVQEFRANPRLRYLAALVLLVLLVEGGLRWADSLTQQQAALTQLQSDLAKLRSHSRDEKSLRASLATVAGQSQAIEQRIWSVPSEAVGQARLKDWLVGVAQRSVADQYNITLGGGGDTARPAATAKPANAALRELRATMSFRFTPSALEAVLAEIEGGQPFAAIDTLSVKRQERKVELTVRVLVRVAPAPAAQLATRQEGQNG